MSKANIPGRIGDLEKHYRIGADFIREMRRRRLKASLLIAAFAEVRGYSADTVRKDRRFAAMFSPRELAAICRPKRGIPPRLEVIYMLLQIRDRRTRKRLLRKAITHDWRRSHLEQNMPAGSRPGNSRGAGRPALAESKPGLFIQRQAPQILRALSKLHSAHEGQKLQDNLSRISCLAERAAVILQAAAEVLRSQAGRRGLDRAAMN